MAGEQETRRWDSAPGVRKRLRVWKNSPPAGKVGDTVFSPEVFAKPQHTEAEGVRRTSGHASGSGSGSREARTRAQSSVLTPHLCAGVPGNGAKPSSWRGELGQTNEQLRVCRHCKSGDHLPFRSGTQDVQCYVPGTWDQRATLPPRLTSGCSFRSPWQRQPERQHKPEAVKSEASEAAPRSVVVSLKTVSTRSLESPDGLGDACVTRLWHLPGSQSHWAERSHSVDLNRCFQGPPDRKTEG